MCRYLVGTLSTFSPYRIHQGVKAGSSVCTKTNTKKRLSLFYPLVRKDKFLEWGQQIPAVMTMSIGMGFQGTGKILDSVLYQFFELMTGTKWEPEDGTFGMYILGKELGRFPSSTWVELESITQKAHPKIKYKPGLVVAAEKNNYVVLKVVPLHPKRLLHVGCY